MEKTKRDSIKHKIKKFDPDNLPNYSAKLSNFYYKAFIQYAKRQLTYDLIKDLSYIYRIVDLYAKEHEPYTVCRKGCAWCCTIAVEILPIEFEYIEANTNIKRTDVYKHFSFDSERSTNVGYCPLLNQSNGTCSVYKYRPFNCRAFLVYDSPENCKLQSTGIDSPSANSGGPANGYGHNTLLQLAYDLMCLQMGRDVTEDDREYIDSITKDIRAYF